jgi:hypothetical protein
LWPPSLLLTLRISFGNVSAEVLGVDLKHWSEIPVPARLARRPRDARGYPVPAAVLILEDGKPDFKVTDIHQWLALLKSRRCALCGEPLGRHLAFVGGPLSHKNRYFTDLPMHKECAQYALQVCPYLAAPHFKYAEKIARREGVSIETSGLVSPVRPEFFFLATTKSCEPARGEDGTLLVHAAPWEHTEWWRNGERVERSDTA